MKSNWRLTAAYRARIRKAVRAMAELEIKGRMAMHFPQLLMTWTRQSPANMDDDNLPAASKSIRDEVCKALGFSNDGSVLLKHEYKQEKAPTLQPNVRLDMEIRCLTCTIRQGLTASEDLAHTAEIVQQAASALFKILGD